MASFGAFVFGGAVLNIIARTNDTIILASQSSGGLADAAVFTIATYLVTVMEVPQRSLVSISTPVIAEAWRDKNLPKIDRMYQKTALNLLISGLGIFGLVQLNMDNAIRFLGPEYQALGMIVLTSGVAKLIDLATGLNTQILLLSKYWKIEFLSNMLLVALSIPLNYWLTKKFNVMGPAYGNLIALTVFNFGRFMILRKLFGLQPFRPAHLKAIIIAVLCFLLAYALPTMGNLFLDVIIRSSIFSAAFAFLVFKLRVSEDINGLLDSIKSRLNW